MGQFSLLAPCRLPPGKTLPPVGQVKEVRMIGVGASGSLFATTDRRDARPKAAPGERLDTHDRVRTDRVDQAGVITLRVAGRLHHIGVGRTYTGTRVLVLVQDLNIKIINAATGEPIRQLTLDPIRDYQPTGAPKGPKRKKPRT
jgi:hypothetical protein